MLLSKLGGFWLLPPRDFPHKMGVTLWTTTAIHVDTPKSGLDPIPGLIPGLGVDPEDGLIAQFRV